MLTVLCFLWRDPKARHATHYSYSAGYVNRLRSMLARHLALPHELVCCCDDPAGIEAGIRTVPLPREAAALGTEYPKLYAFHPDAARLFGRRILMIDLDCVIVGPIDALVSRAESFIAWAPPEHSPSRLNTSLVLMDGGAFPHVWADFRGAPSIAALRADGFEGWEQDWVARCLSRHGARWPRSGAGIESFGAVRRRGLPETARVVFFNGHASPELRRCRAAAPWIEAHWR